MDEINSINSMLIECVKAAGGSKVVGPMLWPDLTMDKAQRKLLDCLNEDRPEKLSPDQGYFIEKLAKKSGSHIAIEFRAKDMSYSQPTPIKPFDEMAELMKQFIQSQEKLSNLALSINEIKSRNSA